MGWIFSSKGRETDPESSGPEVRGERTGVRSPGLSGSARGQYHLLLRLPELLLPQEPQPYDVEEPKPPEDPEQLVSEVCKVVGGEVSA